ncbi:MAG TPA: hypothetical protein VFX12_06375 [Vicinamibacterales bacterium]|nr:hypothetical protein [Vicinamibacterales bacterium]
MIATFEPGSFRDRHARILRHEGRILRVLSPDGLRDWERLAATRLFRRHVDAGTLVRTSRPDDEAQLLRELEGGAAAVLEHEPIPFISYPYEWTFGMLRDAARLHLDLLRDALDEGLILKDATAYNVQFVGARPLFIDIGSFTPLGPGEPWNGYRQFCQLFLYPLMLQAYKDVPFQPWLRGSLEGIDAREMRGLMGTRDRLRPGVLAHVVLQAAAQDRFETRARDVRQQLRRAGFSPALIKANVTRLRRLVERLEWTRHTSTWAGYAGENTYSSTDAEQKAAFVRRAVSAGPPALVWDLGANAGTFSAICAEYARDVVAIDADALVVERMYQGLRGGTAHILPLVGNVADPSPGLGWRGEERLPLRRRGAPDLTLCLALIHHVVISANVPLPEFVDWLAGLGGDLVIEFVEKDDPMVRRLLLNKQDQYSDYDRALFEDRLALHYDLAARESIQDGHRVLYHAVRRR